MIEASAARWPLLSAVYHRVRKRGQYPTDRAAQIAIEGARRSGRLRMRATRFVYKAQPGPRLAPGEQPPQLEPIITLVPIYPTDIFDHWDLERSCARLRRDAKSKSNVWYHQIEVHHDDEQNLWPSEPEASPPTKTAPEPPKEPINLPRSEWSEVPAGSPKDSPILEGPKRPEDVTPRVWLAIVAISEVERADHICSTDIDQDDLLIRARRRMPERSPGTRVSLGLRTLQTAQAYLRKQRNKPGPRG